MVILPQFKERNSFLVNSFFPPSLVEWNEVVPINSYPIFKKKILNFTRPCSINVFNVCHPKGLILLTCLDIGISHSSKYKSKHSFLDPLNPICICSLFFPLPRFTNERQNLLLKIESIISDIFRKTNSSITSTLLYGNPSFWAKLNTNIPNSSIDHILSTKGLNLLSLQRLHSQPNSSLFVILQLNRFLSFVLFYPHFIFC